MRGSYIQTSIVISAKDLKLLGGVFHKIYFCKDIIRVRYIKLEEKLPKKKRRGSFIQNSIVIAAKEI